MCPCYAESRRRRFARKRQHGAGVGLLLLLLRVFRLFESCEDEFLEEETAPAAAETASPAAKGPSGEGALLSLVVEEAHAVVCRFAHSAEQGEQVGSGDVSFFHRLTNVRGAQSLVSVGWGWGCWGCAAHDGEFLFVKENSSETPQSALSARERGGVWPQRRTRPSLATGGAEGALVGSSSSTYSLRCM